jgi:ubiquinol-cytochrome c reductase cytochrome c subunit
MTRVVLVSLLGLTCVAAKAQAPRAKDASGDASKGKRIYHNYGCDECHGGGGQGSILSGPRIAPDPIPFTGLVTYVRQPRGQMPPYTRKVMSDAELADVYAFLRSLPKPPDPKEIPILKY